MKTQITILAVLVALLLGLLFYQNRAYNELVKMLEQQDTTFVTNTQVDTLYFEKEYRDTIPQATTITILKRDTLYRQMNDTTVEATPVLISFKKKAIPMILR